MGKLKHSIVGTILTKDEWEAGPTHLIGGVADLNIVRTATLVVAASDALATSQAQADKVCSGSADDVDIQAAIDALPAVGGKILLSEGTFNIAATITIAKSNLVVEGMGRRSTILKLANNINVDMFSTNGAYTNIHFKNFEVDGNESNQTVFIKGFNLLGGADNIYFENCYLHDFAGVGIEIRNANYASIINTEIKTVRGKGTQAKGIYFFTLGDIYCENVKIDDADDNGIAIFVLNNHAIFNNCQITNTVRVVAGHGSGIVIDVATGLATVEVNGGYYEGNAYAGLESNAYRTIINNACCRLNERGVQIEDSVTYNKPIAFINGSILSDNTLNGLQAIAFTYIEVNGGEIRHNGVLSDADAAHGNGILFGFGTIAKKLVLHGVYIGQNFKWGVKLSEGASLSDSMDILGCTIAENGIYARDTYSGVFLPNFVGEQINIKDTDFYDRQDSITSDLASDAASGQKDVILDDYPTHQGFAVGMLVTISDDTPDTENNQMASINEATKTLTMTTNLAHNYTTAQNALVTGRTSEKYGVESTGTSDNIKVIDNDFDGHVTAPLLLSGSSNKVEGNTGYVTEHSGTSSIDSGQTAKVVAHGLSAAPTVINIAFREQGTSDFGRWWVDTIGAINFTLNVSIDPGVSNLDFAWEAKVRQ